VASSRDARSLLLGSDFLAYSGLKFVCGLILA
jgi:hypothetical protein